MKTAVVYDDTLQKGGGEGFLKDICKAVGSYDLFCPIVKKDTLKTFSNCKNSKFLTFLANLGKYGYYLASFLSPLWFEKLNLDSYKRVLILSNRFSLSTITSDFVYSYLIVTTPNRYVWKNSNNLNSVILNILRVKDFYYSKRHNKIISISKTTQKRVKKYWRAESSILYPPVKDVKNKANKHIFVPFDNFFLIVGRQSKHKTQYFKEALDNFPKNENIVFVGKGEKYKYLKKRYKNCKNIYFTGVIKDTELIYLYKKCVGLIHPQIEEFGLTPLEALQFNKPIIAYKKGGVVEYLNSNVALFYNNPKQLSKCISNVKIKKFNSNEAIKIVQLHSFKNFKYNLKQTFKNYEKSV